LTTGGKQTIPSENLLRYTAIGVKWYFDADVLQYRDGGAAFGGAVLGKLLFLSAGTPRAQVTPTGTWVLPSDQTNH
jgi:hypothetical protein